MTTLNLFAEKIAVTPVTEELEGSIIFPESRHIRFELGKVIATGNGHYRTGEERQMWVKTGDIIMFQLGGPQIANAVFKLDDKPIKIFHQGDAIARLKTNIVKVEDFEILGNWVLLRPEVEKSLIVIPDKCAPPESFRFFVEQIGAGFAMGNIHIGDEVFPERGKCCPLEIDGKTYVYTLQDFLHGVLTPHATEDSVAAPEA